MSEDNFDVFLSHNSKDKPAVRELKRALADRDVSAWLDADELQPGLTWQNGLQRGIINSRSVAVCLGASGMGPWQSEEMQAALTIAAQQQIPVIPVVLPGAPEKPELQIFLANRTWVDLREGFTDENIGRLIWGITGQKPAPPPKTPKSKTSKLIAVSKLPATHGAQKLIGRDSELRRLNQALKSDKIHIVSIVAWGGVGKTSLVYEWMMRLASRNWPGIERYFDWSFYSQGSSDQSAASADTFIAAALA
jgi:hypothetical protein